MVRRFLAVVMGLLLAGGLPAPSAQAHPERLRPVLFVHGFSGSGAQFETPARRLTGNGYPIGYIEAHEYDSLFAANTEQEVYAGLDRRIGGLLARTKADRVDLVAHSLGTRLMQTYLNSSPERAASVAHYVNLDGMPAAAPPGGVPTLAIWGEGSPERRIDGARNVYFPGQSHTETVTSAESFAEMFRFFTGHGPRTTAIVPEKHITLSGRAVLFPSNVGAAGARLEIYRVRPGTGERRPRRPIAVYPITGDGSWGPVRARGDARYEFTLVWGERYVHHIYYQPFRRSDALVRLLTSRPGEGIAALTETSPRHTNLTISRQREWWGDQGAQGDSLTVDGTQILNAANSPRAKRAIGIFAYDAGVDGATELTAPIPAFFGTPFLTGVDLFVPAGDRTVPLVARPRGGGTPDVLRVPALPSDVHRISVQFDDY